MASAEIEWTEAGAPRSRAFGDVYFRSRAETDAVFVAGGGLPERLRAGPSEPVRISELGFGVGLNFCASLAACRAAGARGLDYVAVECAPPDADDLRRALAPWPDLAALAGETLAAFGAWPPPPGWTAARLAGAPSARLTLGVGDAAALMSAAPPRAADIWYLDGFSPSRNPDLWTPDLLRAVFAATRPGGRVTTYAAAGHVRRSLEAAGFAVTRLPGFAGKRERLQADRP